MRLTDFGLAKDLSRLAECAADADAMCDIALRIEAEAAGVRWPAGVLEWAKRQDATALGLTLAELFFSALARAGPGERTSRAALRRLLQDVFAGDMRAAREFCAQEDDWADAVALLDECAGAGDGWGLLADLLEGRDLEDVLQRSGAFLLAADAPDGVR